MTAGEDSALGAEAAAVIDLTGVAAPRPRGRLRWAAKRVSLGLLAVAAVAMAAVFLGRRLAPHYYDLIVVRLGDWTTPLAREITREDALADWDVVERIVRTGYVGYDYFRQRGTDWDAQFARGRASLAAHASPISGCEFAWTVHSLFRSVSDEHLSVMNAGRCGGAPTPRPRPLASDAWFGLDKDARVLDAAPAAAPIGSRLLDCAGRDVAKDLHFAARKIGDHWQFGRRIIYMTKTGREALTCRFQTPDGRVTAATMAMDWLNDKDREPPKTIGVALGGTVYLRLGTSSPKEEEGVSTLLDSADAAASARAIIADLRGNGGGFPLYFDTWASGLFRGVRSIGGVVRLTSETTQQAEFNLITNILARGIGGPRVEAFISGEAAEGLVSLIEAEAASGGASWRDVEESPLNLTGRADRPFAGKMLLIVDRGCASACEEAVETARDVFDAVVVGTNTWGVHAFLEPYPYRLPKSGLVVRAASKMQDPAWLDSGEFREERGFVPDVWMDLRDDGAAAREMGDCLADPACAEQILPAIKKAGERRRDISYY